MKLNELAKIASPVGILLIILYFGIVGLLIADKTNDNELLYFAEILVAIIMIIIAVTIVSRVNILQLLSNRNQIAINSSPACFALYDMEDRTFKASDNLINVMVSKNKDLTFDEFLSYFTNEDQAEIGLVLHSAHYSSDYSKIGIIKMNEGASNEKYYRYICKLIATKFGGKVVYFWLIDYSDVINDEIELVELIRKYREASFELGQIIDNLPIPIWRLNEDSKLIYNNSKFSELSKLYNIDIADEYIASKQQNFVKRFTNKDKIEAFTFNKITLSNHLGTIGFCLNSTEMELLQRSVKILENILEKLIENISVGFLILDQDLRVINFNLAFVNIFLFDSDLLAKKPNYRYVLDIMKENNLFPELIGYKEKHLQDIRQVSNCTTDLIHLPNGNTIKLTVIPGKDGNTILIYENITPNLEIEQELTKTRLMFRSAINMIEFPIVIISQNGHINYINEIFVKTLFHYSLSSDLPTNINELMCDKVLKIKNDDINKLKGLAVECLESKKCETINFKISKSKFVASTVGLDDLSVILTIKKIK